MDNFEVCKVEGWRRVPVPALCRTLGKAVELARLLHHDFQDTTYEVRRGGHTIYVAGNEPKQREERARA